jgi:hypothetical protein
MVTTPARRAVPSRFASRFNRGRGLRGMGDCGLGQILASAVASDAQAAAAGFPAAGKLSSTEDLQVVVNSGGAYVYQDEGQIAQNILTSLGIPLSDAQNLTSAQTQAILNAVAAATSTAAATGAACAVGLFGETSCFNFGSVTVGTTTVYVVAAALALLFLFGGKR